mgnify:FL=1
MTITENKTALNTNDNATVYVVDAYGYYPEVLVSDEDGKEFFVKYGDLLQCETPETEKEAEEAWLQSDRESVWLREA